MYLFCGEIEISPSQPCVLGTDTLGTASAVVLHCYRDRENPFSRRKVLWVAKGLESAQAHALVEQLAKVAPEGVKVLAI